MTMVILNAFCIHCSPVNLEPLFIVNFLTSKLTCLSCSDDVYILKVNMWRVYSTDHDFDITLAPIQRGSTLDIGI